MQINFGDGQMEVPEELYQKIIQALNELGALAHQHSLNSHVVVKLDYQSNCLSKMASMVIAVGAVGMPVQIVGSPEAQEAVSNEAQAAIDRAMAQAKAKAEENKDKEDGDA